MAHKQEHDQLKLSSSWRCNNPPGLDLELLDWVDVDRVGGVEGERPGGGFTYDVRIGWGYWGMLRKKLRVNLLTREWGKEKSQTPLRTSCVSGAWECLCRARTRRGGAAW